MSQPNHWQERSRNWGRIGPPKRPTPEVIGQVVDLVGKDTPVLVLGVTQGLVDGFTNVLAVDREPAMIAKAQMGNGTTKRVERMDWFDIPGEDRFDAIVGDGSINMASYPYRITALLERMHQLLKPGGRLACRVFIRPEAPITLPLLMDIARTNPAPISFDTWRTCLSHHLAQANGPNVPVREMKWCFDYHWPDRAALAAASGWDPELFSIVMDAYAGSEMFTAFPTKAELMRCVPSSAREVALIPTHGYDLCEQFPILTFTKEA